MIISFNHDGIDYLNIDTDDEISVKMVTDLIGEKNLDKYKKEYVEPISNEERLLILEKKLEESNFIISELLEKLK